jgi:hypothetical protein
MLKKSLYIFSYLFLIALFYAKGNEDLDSINQNQFNKTISIDGTYFLSILFKTEEPRITPFNFEFNVLKNIKLRTGFNLDHSTATNKGLNLDLKIGFEKLKRYSSKWNYYYGVDINSAYVNYNDRPNTISTLSALPFICFEIFISKQFSFSYEPRLIYSLIKYEDPESFTEKTIFEEEFKLTGFSHFFINFNF